MLRNTKILCLHLDPDQHQELLTCSLYHSIQPNHLTFTVWFFTLFLLCSIETNCLVLFMWEGKLPLFLEMHDTVAVLFYICKYLTILTYTSTVSQYLLIKGSFTVFILPENWMTKLHSNNNLYILNTLYYYCVLLHLNKSINIFAVPSVDFSWTHGKFYFKVKYPLIVRKPNTSVTSVWE